MPHNAAMWALSSGTEVRFCGYRSAENLLFGSWPTHLVTIATPGAEGIVVPRWFGGAKLELEFRDTRDPQDPEAASYQHVRAIERFCRSVSPGSKVLVTCAGGYSRSSAVALVVLAELGMSLDSAFAQLDRTTPPNPVLLRCAHLHLQSCEDLIESWTSWLTANGLHPDYFAPLKQRRSRPR